MKKISLYLLIFFIISAAKAQIGIPEVQNFSSAVYKGGTQNWAISQDQLGVMYFANNEGLLSYNGRYWKIYPLPNKTVVRSVKIAQDGKIYIGGQDELGYFYPNERGLLKFHSLKNLIPEKDRQLEDVWEIVLERQEVFFRTSSKILHLKNDVFTIYKSKGNWEFLGEVNGKIYAQDNKLGLMQYDNQTWEPLLNQDELNNTLVTAILPYKDDKKLITTNKSGLFLLESQNIRPLETNNNTLFKKLRVYDAISVNQDWYALATVSGGCLIINHNGDIIQQFSTQDNLQKDNLRCVFQDKNQNLWLGLDDGIDLIAFNNAVKYIYPDDAKQTSSYATAILNNQLFVGTSVGVFKTNINENLKDLSFSKNTFTAVDGSQGQVWNLNIINKNLILSHEEGAFEIKGSSVSMIYHFPGTWMLQPLSTFFPSKEIIAGTYDGLQAISYDNGNYINNGNITNVNESLRFIVYDDNLNTIWASHPYRGIFSFKLSAGKNTVVETKTYAEESGLPSALGNYVAKIKNRIVVATLKGLYEFDQQQQKFIPSPTLHQIFGDINYQYLKEDQYGNVWFVSNKKVGVVDFSRKENNKNYAVVYFPELSNKVVAGFENIYPYDNENIFIGATKGLIHINYLNYLKNIKHLGINLTQVNLLNNSDSIIFGGYFIKEGIINKDQYQENIINLDYRNNSLHFEYAASLYEQKNNIEFSYLLEGFDKAWSFWSSKSEKDYTNLPYGKYTFKVKARNNLGNSSLPVAYNFVINPAWYQTWWFYMFCFLLFCFFMFILIERQRKKHEKEQEYLKKEYQLDKEHNENEIVKLQNEKLETEVNFKNKELATATMHLMQRGKLISKIKEELLPIVKTENIEESPEEFKKILSLINDAERADSDWEHFAIHFDHVHSNFLTKLKDKIPALSANDLKLCAYLKMNLSSKEIAQLMSVTVRAVEVSRYRLRKKLDVTTDTNLFDYLIEITS
jgi:ligand-binding sensor domain-containing protein/DNA-binding CsgD family transcriptional regulator